MSLYGTLLVGGGSAFGALARYGVGNAISRVNNSEFPWGTWITNLLGTLLFGWLFEDFSSVHLSVNWWL